MSEQDPVIPAGVKATEVKGDVTVVGAAAAETDKQALERKQATEQVVEGADKEKPVMSPTREELYQTPMWLLWNKKTGKLRQVWVIPPPASLISKNFAVWPVELAWTKPNWERQSGYRSDAQIWNDAAQQLLIDRRVLHRNYLDAHLKEAKGLLDAEGGEIKIEHQEDGTLKTDVMRKILSLDTAVLDTAIFLYEKDVLLSSQ